MKDLGCIIVILGVAQDAGVPQLGCECKNCARASEDNNFRRFVSSLGIVNLATGNSYIIDTTPNFIEQNAILSKHKQKFIGSKAGKKEAGNNRSELGLDGIFLTHAHMGHYLGLAQLGKEAFDASGLRFYATDSMVKFLSNNSPFKDMITGSALIPHMITPGEKCLNGTDLDITSLLVPHRHEHSDTVGFVIQGEKQKLLYIPDIDEFTKPVLDKISEVDIALLDGTFYTRSELLPGRKFEAIKHPLISESMDQLKEFLKNTKIYFTHFNHTNPVLAPTSKERSLVESLGFGIAQQEQIIRI